jgi:transposase InsO family protein
MMDTVEELTPLIGTRAACAAVGVSHSSVYRARRGAASPPPAPPARKPPPRALSPAEREHVLQTLCEQRFVDLAPEEVYATLLDEGLYLCSVRTMYRILAGANSEGIVRERRNQLTHPAYTKPELLAQAPNELWSWDISKLKGPAKWTYYYLYVIIDVFSRYIVGWTVAYRENGDLAQALIAQAAEQQHIQPAKLTLHADRGSPMRSKPVAFLLADLGITKTHSRPYTSSDNPYSEANFKTLKYRPAFPERFTSIEHAREHCRQFVGWYNHRHHHCGIALMTPAAVHYGHAPALHTARQGVLDIAYRTHPERFVHRAPVPPKLPTAVWINKPRKDPEKATADTVPGSPGTLTVAGTPDAFEAPGVSALTGTLACARAGGLLDDARSTAAASAAQSTGVGILTGTIASAQAGGLLDTAHSSGAASAAEATGLLIVTGTLASARAGGLLDAAHSTGAAEVTGVLRAAETANAGEAAARHDCSLNVV